MRKDPKQHITHFPLPTHDPLLKSAAPIPNRLTDREVVSGLRQNGYSIQKSPLKKTAQVLQLEAERLRRIKSRQAEQDDQRRMSHWDNGTSGTRPASPGSTIDASMLFDDAYPGEYLILKHSGVIVGTPSFDALMQRNRHRLGNIFHLFHLLFELLDNYAGTSFVSMMSGLDYIDTFSVKMAQVKCHRLEELAGQLIYYGITQENLYSCFTRPDVSFLSLLLIYHN